MPKTRRKQAGKHEPQRITVLVPAQPSQESQQQISIKGKTAVKINLAVGEVYVESIEDSLDRVYEIADEIARKLSSQGKPNEWKYGCT